MLPLDPTAALRGLLAVDPESKPAQVKRETSDADTEMR